MTYSFDQAPDRRGTNSKKWELMYALKPAEQIAPGVVPMSTADMEFETAPEIYQGLIDYIETKPVLGYNFPTEATDNAVVRWQHDHHQFDVDPAWLVYTHGTVDALAAGVKAFTQPGDGVIIFQPVYHPFSAVIEDNDRKVVDVSLIENDGYYTIDFDAFEAAAREEQNKALIFCSPHNPVGRVWTPKELERLTEIAVANELYVISDEIWNDFTRDDLTHTSLATFDERLDERLVVCTSASKTFNLAGAKCAISIVPNEATRERFSTAARTDRTTIVNGFGPRTVEIAYTKGDAWYEEMLQVIHHNQRYVAETFERELPEVKAPVCEGTYCAWVDCRVLHIDDETLQEWCIEADCFPSFGVEFGTEGSGFIRLNLACPFSAVETVIEQLINVFKAHMRA
ncbi:MAG: pyridoxal phosphate-dependent aminotransferase [Aerococcus sp.]|nr:pyridoxal phosphate-dependent aminotransferase [Aerococcus sp.]